MPDYLTLGGPLPQSLGGCADLLHDVRELRLQMEKEADTIKRRESEIKEHLITNLSKRDDTGSAGRRYRAQVKTTTKMRVATGDGQDGWGMLYAWIRQNDRFDMLQRRLSDKAVEDWVADNGQPLPGTEKFNAVDISITKI